MLTAIVAIDVLIAALAWSFGVAAARGDARPRPPG
jgi:hypothetical protein